MSIEKLRNPDNFEGKVITPDLLKCVHDAGIVALEVRRRGLTSKVKSTKEDLVTEGDLAVSSILQARLSELFPGIVFIDEEVLGNERIDVGQYDLVAIIDPVDGTSNYFDNGKTESQNKPLNPIWGRLGRNRKKRRDTGRGNLSTRFE